MSTPSRIRTCDLRIRSPLLYPAELWAPMTSVYGGVSAVAMWRPPRLKLREVDVECKDEEHERGAK